MWIADQWKDYEVIDCSKGEKLERWVKYLLVRSDPQVIWDTPKTERGWKHMNGHYHRSKKGIEPFCLYRRCNTCSSYCRSKRNTCRRIQRYGSWAKENVASSGLSDKPIGSLL